jgi:hypothetical protein
LGYSFIVDRNTRHKHTLTRETSEPEVAPASVEYSWNGGAWTEVASDTVLTPTVITGDNTLEVRTQTSGVRSSVIPTANYQTFGKS